MRIKYKWEAIEKENQDIMKAKEIGKNMNPKYWQEANICFI